MTTAQAIRADAFKQDRQALAEQELKIARYHLIRAMAHLDESETRAAHGFVGGSVLTLDDAMELLS